MKFYNIGSLNLDYTYFVDEFLKPGETKSSLGLQISCGGKGFNQSIALARAGASVFHGGCIGAEGDRFLEIFQREQIDPEFIEQTAEKNGHAVIQVNEEGENCILLFGGTNQKVSKKLIDRILSSVEKQDMIVLQNEICHLEYILEEAQRKGIKAALNAAPVSEEIKKISMDSVEWLFVNETEGSALTGCSETEPEKILDCLTERYHDTGIVLTLGGNGAFYGRRKERIYVPAYKVNVVDSTAAGDTFIGYFLACMSRGMSVEESMRYAAMAGAVCVGKKGASDSIPRWKEVQGLMSTR